MAILNSRRLFIRPLVMKLRTSRFGIQALHRVLAEESLGLVGIPLELSSISFLRLARCRLSGPLNIASCRYQSQHIKKNPRPDGILTIVTVVPAERFRSWRNSVSRVLGAKVSFKKEIKAGEAASVCIFFRFRWHCTLFVCLPEEWFTPSGVGWK